MDEVIIVSKALPILKIACIVAVVFLALAGWWLRRFIKNHPEALKPCGNPNIKRKFHNFILFIFAFLFLWLAVVLVGIQICYQKFSMAVIIPIIISIFLLLQIEEKE